MRDRPWSTETDLISCSSFGSIRLTVWEEMSFEEFQDGRNDSHFGYLNGTILVILNLFAALISPIKFRLNPT